YLRLDRAVLLGLRFQTLQPIDSRTQRRLGGPLGIQRVLLQLLQDGQLLVRGLDLLAQALARGLELGDRPAHGARRGRIELLEVSPRRSNSEHRISELVACLLSLFAAI